MALKKTAVPLQRNANNKRTHLGGYSIYVDKRPTFEKTCYTSAAKWELRALGGSTIIYYNETITFNNNRSNGEYFIELNVSARSSPPPGGIIKQHRWGFTRSPRPAQYDQDTTLRGIQTWKKLNSPATNNVPPFCTYNTRGHRFFVRARTCDLPWSI